MRDSVKPTEVIAKLHREVLVLLKTQAMRDTGLTAAICRLPIGMPLAKARTSDILQVSWTYVSFASSWPSPST